MFPNHLLPNIVPPGTVVGITHAHISGWKQGIPVYVSLGDVQCATFAILRDHRDAGKCLIAKVAT